MDPAAERLREHIRRAIAVAGGLSALARHMGIQPSSVFAWKGGWSLPGFDKLQGLADVLQVDGTELRVLLAEALQERDQARAERRPRSRPRKSPTT